MKSIYLENQNLRINELRLKNEIKELKSQLDSLKTFDENKKIDIAWKALKWVGFTRGNEFTDNDIRIVLEDK